MVAVEFTCADGTPDTATATRAQQTAAERGLLLTCVAYGVVRTIPPLIADAEQIEAGLRIWSETVDSLSDHS